MKALTKREKILTFSAGLLAIVYFSVQFAILPLASRLNEARADLDRLQVEQLQVEFDIANRADIERINTIAHETLSYLKEYYPSVISTDEVHLKLTDLTLRHGLVPSSLTMTVAPDPTYPDLFTIVLATMTLEGYFDSIFGLLDEVDENVYIRVASNFFTQDRRAETEGYGRISTTFELTYLNPPANS